MLETVLGMEKAEQSETGTIILIFLRKSDMCKHL
jgi:hypothetical protein